MNLDFAEVLGLDETQMKLLVSLVSNVALAQIGRVYLKKRLCKSYLFLKIQFCKAPCSFKYLGTMIGMLLIYYLFGTQVMWIVGQTIIAYVLMKIDNNRVNCGWLITIESLIAVSFCHLYRMYYSCPEIDISLLMMIYTVKWSSFAFKEQYKQSSFLDFFCYIFFFTGNLVGPAPDYEQFKEFIEEETSEIIDMKELMKVVGQFVVCAFIFLIGKQYVQLEDLFTKQRQFMILIQTANSISESRLWQRVMWMNTAVFVQRNRYYAVWLLSDLQMIVSGFSNTKRKVRQIDLGFESHVNVREKLELWNISVQTWLKKHIHMNLMKSGFSRRSSFLLTHLISALWHGFYVGYYLSFLQWAILNQWQRVLNIQKMGFLRRVVWWMIQESIFNTIGATFMLQTADKIFGLYNSLCWLPVGLNVVLYLYCV